MEKEDYMILFLGYFLLSIIINLFHIWINIKIPFYKGKWVRNKKTPIYKLELDRWDDYFKIYKYEIKYSCFWDIKDSKILMIFSVGFMPFSCWFKFPYYKKGYSGYGKFSKKELKDINFDIEEYYEISYKEKEDIYNKRILKEKREKEMLNNINKDFNKHYYGTN
jgi:hypothetical protein